jgi:hypothetical protein
MEYAPTSVKAELEKLMMFREAFNNVKLVKNDMLPPQTMIVSSDLFELIKQLPNEIQ